VEPALSVYRSYDLPPLVNRQIHSFMRIEWTGGYTGERQFRDEVWPEGEVQNTVHFVLEERGFVISQAGVVWKRIEHDGETGARPHRSASARESGEACLRFLHNYSFALA
jgi:hypothetical protein